MPSDASDPDRDVLSRETDEWQRWAAKHLPRQRDRRRFVNCEKAPAGRIQAVARNPEQVRPGPRQQPAPGVEPLPPHLFPRTPPNDSGT